MVGSTTIDLSLSLFPWADFRSTKAGIKMHTQLDLGGPIPTCIHISGARNADVHWLDDLLFEAGSFYVMDRGYMDFARLACIVLAGAFFGTSPNSVKTQIWIAVAVYLMVAILHKQLQLPGRLHRTWLARPLLRIRYGQLLSIHPFEKVFIHELLTEVDFKSYMPHKNNQLTL